MALGSLATASSSRQHTQRPQIGAAATQQPAGATSGSNSLLQGQLQQQQAASAAAAIGVQPNNRQQQQAAVATPTAAAGAGGPATAWQRLPLAALSRVLLTNANANVFRSALGQRRQPVSGPFGVLLFLATLVAASFAAIRSVLVRRGRCCRSCRGFGLSRCRLCLGSGRVDWAAKLQHFDVCPLCMNRRFVVCGDCGGHYHRPMFAHRRRQAGGALEPAAAPRGGSNSNSGGGFGGGSDSEQTFGGPIVLNLAGAGAGAAGGGGAAVVDRRVLSSMSD
jgi:hypothetical protein